MTDTNLLRSQAMHKLAVTILTHANPQPQKVRDRTLRDSIDATAAYTVHLTEINQILPKARQSNGNPKTTP